MPALAQEASVEVTVNATVSQGDLIRVTLSFVNCKVKVDPPNPRPRLAHGPSTSNNTQWINGVTTSKQQYTYGYAVNAAKEVRIPP